MIGFNGGLIGKDRSTSTASSIPGVWTPGEQIKAKRNDAWPFNQDLDLYFANVSLLLYGDGTNGSTTFVDSSSNNFTITPAGNAQISTAQSKFGGASMYFDGSGDHLTTPVDADFQLGSGDFTIEYWFYRVASSSGIVVQMSSGTDLYSALIGYLDNQIYISSSGSGWEIASGQSFGTITNNTWTHLALTRSGSTFRAFNNGVQQSTWTSSAAIYQASNAVRIGSGQNSGFSINGYIDDFRITKGIARYDGTSNFTPPTASFSTLTPGEPYFYNTSLLLHGDGTNGSTTFVDSSPNAFTVTPSGNAQISTAQSKFGGASMYFDGSGDYLSCSQPADGTADTTIEFWMYPTSSTVIYRALVDTRSTPGSDTGFAILQYGLIIEVYGNGLKFSSSANAITVNQWQHVAIVRSQGTCQIYVNGIASGASASYASNLTSTSLIVGSLVSFASPYVGYIDDLRITKGIARYDGTSNFTPPTAAFPDA